MVKKDSGVVLKSARSGETSALITFFGRESGKIRLIGKGARTARSPFRGALEPGNVLDVVYYHKEGRTLFFLKEVNVVSTIESAARSLTSLAAVLAALELTESVAFWESPESRIVDLIEEYVHCRADDPLSLLLAFEFKLLEILGALPDFGACARCGAPIVEGDYHPEEGVSVCSAHATSSPHRVRLGAGDTAALREMASSALPALAARRVEAAVRKRLGQLMHWTYTFHVQGYSLPEALKLIPKGER